MEIIGPAVCEAMEKLEYFLKGVSEEIKVQVLDPSHSVVNAMIYQCKNPTEKCIEIYPNVVGIYSITIYGNSSRNPLVQRECFCYNLNQERCHFEELHGSLADVHIVMETKMHQSIMNVISVQAHLITQVPGKSERSNVMQCTVNSCSGLSSDFSFKPPQFGSYEIVFFCGHKSMKSPRLLVHIIDYSKFKLVHSFTRDSCLASIKQKVSFIFDLYGAPSNYLQAWVEGPDKIRVDILLYGEERKEKIGQLRCDFVPSTIGKHSLLACYGDVMFEKCPMIFQVFNEDLVTVVSVTPQTPNDRIVGDTLCVTYDCSQCGSGQLTLSPIMQVGSGVTSLLPSKTNGLNNRGIITFTVQLNLPGRCVINASYNDQICKGVSLSLMVRSSPEKQIPTSSPGSIIGTEKVVSKNQVKEEVPVKAIRRAKKAPDPKKRTKISLDFESTSKGGDHINAQTSDPAVTGEGLIHASVGEVATFTFDPKEEAGQLMIDVQGPRSLAKCLIRPDPKSGQYNVEYYPKEIGHYIISILWNGKLIPGSPFQVTVTGHTKIRCINYPDIFEKTLFLSTGKTIQVDFDSGDAGNGEISAQRISEGSQTMLKCWSDLPANKWSFFVEAGESADPFHVDVLWNKTIIGQIHVEYKTSNDMVVSGTSQTIDHSLQIVLKGHGIKEAWVGEETEFVVDVVNAGEGFLNVYMNDESQNENVIPIRTNNLISGCYLCQYAPNIPGNYWLNIQWGTKTLKGSPFPVKVWNSEPSRQVQCQGDGLMRGFVGEETYIQIIIGNYKEKDVTLSVSFFGPKGESVMCDLEKKSLMMYHLKFVASSQGKHQLNILYGDRHVPGSPFHPLISNLGTISNIVVNGPGLASGSLDRIDSRFTIDTREAGRGKLTVQVKGPQESFHVEVQKDFHDERLIHCSYNPIVAGEYTISICWDGVLTHDSPYKIELS